MKSFSSHRLYGLCGSVGIHIDRSDLSTLVGFGFSSVDSLMADAGLRAHWINADDAHRLAKLFKKLSRELGYIPKSQRGA